MKYRALTIRLGMSSERHKKRVYQSSKLYPTSNKTIQQLLQSRQLLQKFLTGQLPSSAVSLVKSK